MVEKLCYSTSFLSLKSEEVPTEHVAISTLEWLGHNTVHLSQFPLKLPILLFFHLYMDQVLEVLYS